jgi:hypothetical protein
MIVATVLVASALAIAGLIAAGRGRARESEPVRPSGPVISLYVVDHHGTAPDGTSLAPYLDAFRRVLGGCWIGPSALASVVFQLSDQASMGSGTTIDNLGVLQELTRQVGPTRADCSQTFAVAEARLQGGALD